MKLGIPIAHIEAGLRSFDRAMPEEHNRVLTDHLSDILLAHSEEAITNLQREGITSGVHLVGNTMIDTLLEHLDKARERQQLGAVRAPARRVRPRHAPPPRARRRPRQADRGHRRADHARRATARSSSRCTRGRSATWSRPATTRACATRACSRPSRSGYLDFLCLEADAAFVLTDSGGVQEETTALGVRCFTLRDSTERRVTEELGTNTVLGAKPERIAEIPQLLERPKPGEVIPGWDGPRRRARGRGPACVPQRLIVAS